MTDFPSRWPIHKVCEVGSVQLGRQRSPKDHSGTHMRPYLRVANVYEDRLDLTDVKEMNFSPTEFGTFELKVGDILLNEGQSKELVGRPAMYQGEIPGACFQNTLVRFRPHEQVLARFAFALFRHYMRSGGFQRICKWTTNIAHLGAQRFGSMEFPVPPLAEQKRISQKVDSMLELVDRSRARLQRVPEILKKFRQAVLEAAVSGRLTEEWRTSNSNSPRELASDWLTRILTERQHTQTSTRKYREPSQPDLTHWSRAIPDGWAMASVSAFTECLDYARVPVKREDRKSALRLYPYFGANGLVDMVDDFIFDGELVLVTEDETFYGREKPIAYRVSGRCWVNNHAHVLRLPDGDTADYVCFSLMHYNVIPWLTGTTGRAKLTQGVLNALPISIPPRTELVEVVRRVRALFTLADTLETTFASTVARVQKLTPSVLAKAFRGELVQQDPTDEPAGEMSEKIRRSENGARSKPAKVVEAVYR